MDAATHALASLAVARAALPRASRSTWVLVILAGTFADVDFLSANFGPSAYLRWHRTCTHSLVIALVVAVLLGLVFRFWIRPSSLAPVSPVAASAVLLASSLLHIALDACQSYEISPLWPFRNTRLAWDWVAAVDPWIIAIFLATLLLPELLRLVGDEIASKRTNVRGRWGAVWGLVLVFVYIGARAVMHSNAVATLQSRTYRGELPRRVGAFPEAVSLFTWHAVVETEHAMHQLVIDISPGAPFDPEASVALFKPEPSPTLDVSLKTPAARQFLAFARFPKATVEKNESGYEVEILDLRDVAVGGSSRDIVAAISVDLNLAVRDASLIWARELRQR